VGHPGTDGWTGYSIGRKEQADTEIPAASPQQEARPRQHDENDIFKQQLQCGPAVQPPRRSRQRPTGKQDGGGDGKTGSETDDVGAEVSRGKYERIEDVPDASPDAD